MRETADLLAALALSGQEALWRLIRTRHQLGILDGIVVQIDRLGGDNNRQ